MRHQTLSDFCVGRRDSNCFVRYCQESVKARDTGPWAIDSRPARIRAAVGLSLSFDRRPDWGASIHCLRVARGDAIRRLPALPTLVDRALREASCPVRVGAVADLVAASWLRGRPAVSWFGYRLEKTRLVRRSGFDCGECLPYVLLQFIADHVNCQPRLPDVRHSRGNNYIG
jgi:hypothetical protein